MATNDESMATRVEDWICTAVQAIQFNSKNAFEAGTVLPWTGTDAGTVKAFSEELFRGTRERIARVSFLDDQTFELADGQIKTKPTYLILIGVKDLRDVGQARRGDGTLWGTNAMRDLLESALNQKRPNITDGTRHTDKSHWLGASIAVLQDNFCIMDARVAVDVVPKQG